MVIFNFLIRLVLLAAVFFAWFKITPPPTAFLFPLGILSLVMVGFMAGLLLTPIGLLYSDVSQSIPIAALLLMFLTPVLYPQPTGGIAGFVAGWNPLTPLVNATRDWLTTGATGQLDGFLMVTGVTAVLLVVGWVIYRLALPHIISRIGN